MTQITIRTLLTNGMAIVSDLTVADGESPVKAITRHGSEMRLANPQIAKIDWIGHQFAWVGHTTDEQMAAIADDEIRQLSVARNVDGTDK